MENKDKKINGKQEVKEVKKKSSIPKTKKNDNKLAEENKALQEKVLRLTAEIMNIKKRNEDEISKLCKYDGEKVITEILPILDNFERAIKLDDRDLADEVSKFLSGFKMIYTNLLNTLEKLDVKEIECKGLEFDPTKMEAVMTDKDDNLPANVVLEVLQKGYTYKDKVIRVAMVKVNE